MSKHSKSQMPEGDFTWSTGHNHGLDSFYHDTRYDEGAASNQMSRGEDIEHPQTGGHTHLPDGVVVGNNPGLAIEAPTQVARLEDAFDLTAFLGEGDVYAEGQDLSGFLGDDFDGAVDQILREGALEPGALSDLTWLDPYQGQDPNRLPHDDHDSLSELHDIWNSNAPPRVAAGVRAVPGTVDREAASYFQSLDSGPVARPNPLEAKLASDRIKSVIQHAVRRSTYGDPMSVIAVDVLALLGDQAHKAKRALEIIEQEHGLSGNVFIRASAFPGLENGRWADKIKKRVRNARYILATPGTTLASHQVFMGRKVVSEIPWREAYNYYAPRLASAGYKVASTGDPRILLRRAFRGGPPAATERRTAEGKPVFVPPADTISLDDARKAFDQMPKPERQHLSPKGAHQAQARRNALVRLAKWVKAQMLPREDARRLGASTAPPRAILDTAAKLILASRRGHYLGEGEGALPGPSEMDRTAAWAALEHIESNVVQKQAEVEAAMRRTLELNVQKWQGNGQITEDEARTLLAINKSAAEVMEIATALIHDTGRHRNAAIPEAVPAKPYEGAVFRDNPHRPEPTQKWSSHDLRVMAAAKQGGVKPAEITTMVRWARIQMTEGSIGHELDMLIQARFASPLRQAAAPFIEEARNAHEGLSGHVYVDAQAYASREGVTGCDAGSLVHRRNNLKFVLAMDRCGGCTLNNGGLCQKYRKALVDSPPVEDPVSYQVEAIRLANASDAEVTASMFSQNTYNPSEYGLGNNALDDINLNASLDAGSLGDVLWGDGFNIDF